MNKFFVYTIIPILTIILTGCVPYAEDIAPTYEGTEYIRTLSCKEIGRESRSIEAQLKRVSQTQDQSAKSDRLNIVILGVMAWRNLLTIDRSEEISELKGKLEILEQVADEKKC